MVQSTLDGYSGPTRRLRYAQGAEGGRTSCCNRERSAKNESSFGTKRERIGTKVFIQSVLYYNHSHELTIFSSLQETTKMENTTAKQRTQSNQQERSLKVAQRCRLRGQFGSVLKKESLPPRAIYSTGRRTWPQLEDKNVQREQTHPCVQIDPRVVHRLFPPI